VLASLSLIDGLALRQRAKKTGYNAEIRSSPKRAEDLSKSSGFGQ
jgi:hypothetical protein